MAEKPEWWKTDFGPPHYEQMLHPIIKKNYGKWAYHEVVKPGVIKRVAESGDTIYVVRFGTPRLISIYTVRELCDIADKYCDGYLRWTSRHNVEFIVTDESKIDDLIKEVQERIKKAAIYFYMFLSGLYAYTLYAPSLWNKFATFVLFVSLAVALWQKTYDVLPFLLDSVSMPKPRLGVSDGLAAVLFFFVLQGIIFIICSGEGSLPVGARMLIAYSISGFLVTVVTLYIFYKVTSTLYHITSSIICII